MHSFKITFSILLVFCPAFHFVCYALVWTSSASAFSAVNLRSAARGRGEIGGPDFHHSYFPPFCFPLLREARSTTISREGLGILGRRLISSFFHCCSRVQFSWEITKSCFLADKFCCPCLFFLSFLFLAFNSK